MLTFGWSSGCFAALRESGAERLFLYEPPYGAQRDASLVQPLVGVGGADAMASLLVGF
jgi:hypothetical protein